MAFWKKSDDNGASRDKLVRPRTTSSDYWSNVKKDGEAGSEEDVATAASSESAVDEVSASDVTETTDGSIFANIQPVEPTPDDPPSPFSEAAEAAEAAGDSLGDTVEEAENLLSGETDLPGYDEAELSVDASEIAAEVSSDAGDFETVEQIDEGGQDVTDYVESTWSEAVEDTPDTEERDLSALEAAQAENLAAVEMAEDPAAPENLETQDEVSPDSAEYTEYEDTAVEAATEDVDSYVSEATYDQDAGLAEVAETAEPALEDEETTLSLSEGDTDDTSFSGYAVSEETAEAAVHDSSEYTSEEEDSSTAAFVAPVYSAPAANEAQDLEVGATVAASEPEADSPSEEEVNEQGYYYGQDQDLEAADAASYAAETESQYADSDDLTEADLTEDAPEPETSYETKNYPEPADEYPTSPLTTAYSDAPEYADTPDLTADQSPTETGYYDDPNADIDEVPPEDLTTDYDESSTLLSDPTLETEAHSAEPPVEDINEFETQPVEFAETPQADIYETADADSEPEVPVTYDHGEALTETTADPAMDYDQPDYETADTTYSSEDATTDLAASDEAQYSVYADEPADQEEMPPVATYETTDEDAVEPVHEYSEEDSSEVVGEYADAAQPDETASTDDNVIAWPLSSDSAAPEEEDPLSDEAREAISAVAADSGASLDDSSPAVAPPHDKIGDFVDEPQYDYRTTMVSGVEDDIVGGELEDDGEERDGAAYYYSSTTTEPAAESTGGRRAALYLAGAASLSMLCAGGYFLLRNGGDAPEADIITADASDVDIPAGVVDGASDSRVSTASAGTTGQEDAAGPDYNLGFLTDGEQSSTDGVVSVPEDDIFPSDDTNETTQADNAPPAGETRELSSSQVALSTPENGSPAATSDIVVEREVPPVVSLPDADTKPSTSAPLASAPPAPVAEAIPPVTAEKPAPVAPKMPEQPSKPVQVAKADVDTGETASPIVSAPAPSRPASAAPAAPTPATPDVRPAPVSPIMPDRPVTRTPSAPVVTANAPTSNASATPIYDRAVATSIYRERLPAFGGGIDARSVAAWPLAQIETTGGALPDAARDRFAQDIHHAFEITRDNQSAAVTTSRGDRIVMKFGDTRMQTRALPLTYADSVTIPGNYVTAAGWYTTSKSFDLRSAPSRDSATGPRVQIGSAVQRLGLVEAPNGDRWYALGQDGVIAGYAHASELTPLTGSSLSAARVAALPMARSVDGSITTTTPCRDVTITSNGVGMKGTACLSPNGQWLLLDNAQTPYAGGVGGMSEEVANILFNPITARRNARHGRTTASNQLDAMMGTTGAFQISAADGQTAEITVSETNPDLLTRISTALAHQDTSLTCHTASYLNSGQTREMTACLYPDGRWRTVARKGSGYDIQTVASLGA